MANFKSGQDFLNWYERRVKEITNASREAVREAADDGADFVRSAIETRGTMRSGKRGRIETGRMLNAVTSGTVRDSEDEIESRFGWLDDRELYFALQNVGFTHRSGVQVEGMYALEDAKDEVVRKLDREIDRIVSRD
jgi:hypothetical protein